MGWVGGRQGRQLLEGRGKSLVCGGFFPLKGIKMQRLSSVPGSPCVGGRHLVAIPSHEEVSGTVQKRNGEQPC